MMEGYLLRYDGVRIDLPPFTGWKLRRTGSVPCDSFEGTCPWDAGLEPELEKASRLIVEENGARRFTGVLDEYELTWDGRGGGLSPRGKFRGPLLAGAQTSIKSHLQTSMGSVSREGDLLC